MFRGDYMKRVKSCKKCEFYNEDEEFNCTNFKMVILDFKNARKCIYYQERMGKRKRCKTCMYLKYSYVPRINKYRYVCIKTGKIRTYTELVYCNRYKKLNK